MGPLMLIVQSPRPLLGARSLTLIRIAVSEVTKLPKDGPPMLLVIVGGNVSGVTTNTSKGTPSLGS
jgi:hypothetical protein